jgi:hypothetical protein
MGARERRGAEGGEAVRTLVDFMRPVTLIDDSQVLHVDSREGLCRMARTDAGVTLLPVVNRANAEQGAWTILVPWTNVAAFLEAD